MRNYEDAEKWLKRALITNPNPADPRVGLGKLYYEQQRYNEAEKLLLEAVRFDRLNDDAFRYLGRIYKIKGDRKKAAEYFKKADEVSHHKDAPVTGESYNK